MGVLRLTRRLVTASSFEELRVRDVAQSVSAVRAFLKDMPVDAVLTSPDLVRLRASLLDVFAYVRDKTVTMQYPPVRLNKLFEALGRDVADRASAILRSHNVLHISFDDLRAINEECQAVFVMFTTEKERLHIKKALVQTASIKDPSQQQQQQQQQQLGVATASGIMSGIQRRLSAIAMFRAQHEELRTVVTQVLGTAGSAAVEREIDDAFAVVRELDAISCPRDRWEDALGSYEQKIAKVETQLIARLRDSLAQVKDAEEMFRVFSQFNPLFCRARIRGAVQEYQTQLIARVRSRIEALTEKYRASRTGQGSSSSSQSLTVLRDLPTLISRVLWNIQIQR
jgi:dynein heavy chain 1